MTIGKPDPVISRWTALPAAVMAIGVCMIFGFGVGLTSPARSTRSSRSAREHSEIAARIRENSKAEDPQQAYDAAISALQKHYYGGSINIDRTRELTYEAIRGMLGSLHDQFTSYLDPAEWQELVTMTEGRFGGVGALMEQHAGTIRVVRPMAGGPAEKAGVRPEDILLEIDGHSVAGKSIDELGQWLEGDLGTPVKLSLSRGGAPYSVTVVRANIEPPVVEHWMEDDAAKVGHIVLTEFNRKSVSQIDAAYSDLEKRGMKALVLDLRFNPGGLLDAAVDVASIFIPENAHPQLHNNVVIIHHGDGEEEGLTLEPRSRMHRHVPLAVLVNGSSASAAEIVTGALRDYDIGVIIGERTFGKGKVQTLFEMNHGRDGGIRLTTSLYYPPRRYDINFAHDALGNRIPGTGGIVPDIVVPASPSWREDFEDKANDNQLHTALEFLRARLSGHTANEATRIAMAVGK